MPAEQWGQCVCGETDVTSITDHAICAACGADWERDLEPPRPLGTCPDCGGALELTMRRGTCVACGTKRQADIARGPDEARANELLAFCPECGTQRTDGGAFCTTCGHSLKAS